MSSASKKVREQAQEAAGQLVQQLMPRLEEVRDQLDEAREQLAPRLAEARDQLGPVLDQAREQLLPLLDEARSQLDEVRKQAAPYVARAGERLAGDVVPTVQSALKDAAEQARDQAGPLAEEARRLGESAAAAVQGQVRGHDTSSSGGRKKWVALAAVLAGAAVAAKKAMDSGAGTHVGYPAATAPTPMPTDTATRPRPPEPGDTSVASGETADDAAGATPSEALADSAETPHGVTTPDDPAEVTRITPESDA